MNRPLLYDCPRFGHCSAPVCPLWPKSLLGPHRRNEDVCAYLKEAVKPHGKRRLRGRLLDPIIRAIVDAIPVALSLGGDLSRRLRRARRQGSMADSAALARRAKARRSRHEQA